LISTTRSFSLAGRVGERLHASVVQVAAAIEHDALDTGRLGVRREELAHLDGLVGLRALESLQLLPARGGKRPGRVVVQELSGDAQVGAEDGDARPLGGAVHLAADPAPATLAELFLGRDGHQALFPTFLRTYSPW
jgi:hypothetical protein